MNQSSVKFSLDTGADVTVMTKETSDTLSLSLSDPSSALVGADHSKMKVLGESEVEISSKRKTAKAVVFVVEGARRNLLGLPEIGNLELLSVVNAVCKHSFDALKEYPKLFEGLGTMPGEFKIKLMAGTDPFRLYSPRPIAAGLREKAREEIDSMLETGVIEPIEEATSWCSGLTIAPKSNGGIRMCVDLTHLNKGVDISPSSY